MAVMFCSILWIIFFSGNEIFAREIYTNVWAVKVRGIQQEAVELAVKYGLSYEEHVSDSFFAHQTGAFRTGQALQALTATYCLQITTLSSSIYKLIYSREEGKIICSISACTVCTRRYLVEAHFKFIFSSLRTIMSLKSLN